MLEIITKLFQILNLSKDFEAGYDSTTSDEGKMLIVYKGKKYFVKIEDAECDNEDVATAFRRLKYWE